MMNDPLAAEARAIFEGSVAACDVRAAVTRAMLRIDLRGASDVLLIALGKAAAPMHEAANAVVEGRLPVRGVAVAPPATIPATAIAGTTFLAGDHPLPDDNAFVAARVLLEALRKASAQTLVVFLISGGASAMVEAPVDDSIPFKDLVAFHRALVAAGLPIEQMNSLRKHVSAVKGGRLAMAAQHTLAQVTLLVSDVPPGLEDVIASGPTLPDSSTRADCDRIVRALSADVLSRIPATVKRVLADPRTAETAKAGDPAFAHATHEVLLSSEDLVQAAAVQARALGFQTFVDPISMGTSAFPELEYRTVMDHLLARSAELARTHRRVCLIHAGEMAVRLNAQPGEGGRNQQAALYAAQQLARRVQRATVLSAGSDGIDGNSDAAGAVCDETTVGRAVAMGFDCEEALAGCNAAPLLRAVGDQIVTGPTGNNLRDLRLVLTGKN